MTQAISYYDKNAEEFCQATKEVDMSFSRNLMEYGHVRLFCMFLIQK